MPWGDGTGPWGEGPGTGLGLGYCNGYGRPGFANPLNYGGGRWFGRWYGRGRAGFGFRGGFRRGFHRGAGWRGFGFGRRWWGYDYYGPVAPVNYDIKPEDEKRYVEQRLKDVETEMEYLRSRLEELNKKNEGND